MTARYRGIAAFSLVFIVTLLLLGGVLNPLPVVASHCPTGQTHDASGNCVALPTDDSPQPPPSSPSVTEFNLNLEDPIEGGDFLKLLDKVINTLLALAVPISIIMAIYAAFLYTTSGGNEERVKTANKTLMYVVIGWAVLLLSKSVTGIAKEILGAPDATGTEIPLLLEIARVLANVLVAVVGILSVIFVALAGLQYATSGGDEEKVKKARNYIIYAIIGLIVALLSFGITSIVNDLIDRARSESLPHKELPPTDKPDKPPPGGGSTPAPGGEGGGSKLPGTDQKK